MENIAVLGASSKLGQALKRYWAAHPPTGLSLVWHGRDALDEGLPRSKAILALWGVTSGDEGDLAKNSDLAMRAQMLGADAGTERIFHLSSAAVYGAQCGDLDEAAPLRPANAYGRSKARMEAAVAHADGPRGVCLRLANVAGCDSLFRSLARGGAITLDQFSSGCGPLRSYIAVPELASVFEALLRAELSDLPDVLNVAAPQPTAMEEIVHAAGRDVNWRDAPEGAIERVALDVTRLMQFCALGEEASSAAHLVQSWQDYGGWA